ncbi:CPBP family intramembrane glutamic endopeptidase [Microcoleus sp. bin38.metabat.b11b12b14.051]|uniref:CPBP family intramembrane glutamic endopeptidase n=1 Tax=Microcoleus sp. bin38.metabat.b11b12b14.051 TaxID=2742709 RepID=UPI0025D6A8CA|nr:CPBP family intramembrane glutamic endopeptidase [Microcoleus sp. bin38.metabat.b11b12b14.051]
MAEKLPETPEIEPLTRTQVLVAMGVTAIMLLAVAKLWLIFGSVSLLPVKLIVMDLLKGCAIGLAITGGSAIVYQIWPGYRRSADVYLEVVLKPLFWPDLIWLGLLPGLSEELLFRGVMLSALGLNLTGLVLSSFSFGILHLGGMDQWPYAVWATAVGFLLGYSVLATGNLLVPITAHVCTNLISSCVWKWEHNSVKR